METKINIAAILKDKPKGIRLYSPIFGECAFCNVREDTDDICVKKHNGEKAHFDSKGLYCTLGEVMLFPSREMRDWSKFAWKKGDVLRVGVDNICIFDKWNNDEYTEFDAAFVTPDYRSDVLKTKDWHNVIGENVIKLYISKIEKNKGGKLNLTTLEIEPAQPEFKDGDVVCVSGVWYLAYCIVKSIDNSSKKLEYYVLNDMNTLKIEDWLSFEDKRIQPITETQQVILFKALANEGKAWDADKKEVIALKSLWVPRPFDKVLVKDETYGSWKPALFWKRVYAQDLHTYMIIGGKRYRYCEPYEGNENLLDD